MLANARSTFSVESVALSVFASLFRIECSAILLRAVVVKLPDFTKGRPLPVKVLQMTYFLRSPVSMGFPLRSVLLCSRPNPSPALPGLISERPWLPSIR